MTVNTDLAKERANASFDVENLTNFIDGGVEGTKRRRYLRKFYFYIYFELSIHYLNLASKLSVKSNLGSKSRTLFNLMRAKGRNIKYFLKIYHNYYVT